jgi:hypothetical protein
MAKATFNKKKKKKNKNKKKTLSTRKLDLV